jgi:hypothetical protein
MYDLGSTFNLDSLFQGNDMDGYGSSYNRSQGLSRIGADGLSRSQDTKTPNAVIRIGNNTYLDRDMINSHASEDDMTS